MTRAVRAEGLTIGWPGGFTRSVDRFEVASGGHAAVVGPSGCGKSTLLAVLAGETTPLAGTVEVMGERLDRMGDRARRAWRVRHVGRILQERALLDALSVRDNVELPYRLHPALRWTPAVRTRALDALAALGLDDKADRAPATLSTGERQRVAVARALITEPGLVLADEPTTGLDPGRRDAVVAMLHRAVEARGATLVLVTHDPTVAATCASSLDLGRA